MNQIQFARTQILVMVGLIVFCVGSILVHEWWWVKVIFGALALCAAWLALCFAVWLHDRRPR